MLPYLVIGVAALIGLSGWGLKGFIIGAIGGVVVDFALGSLFTLFSGGLLPRKVRKQTASEFIALYADLVQSAFPDTSQTARQKTVEGCIERIFKRAATDNKSMNLEAALYRDAIQSAASAIIAEEQRPEMKVFFASLLQYIDPDPSKEDLIRSLVKKRVSNDPMASRMGFDARMVDSLDAIQLISTPEGSIVTIVETYALLKKQGASDRQIFDRIEAHRSTIGSGAMPSPLDLESYTQYRIAVECRRRGQRHELPMASGFVSEAVQICRQHFGC